MQTRKTNINLHILIHMFIY